MTFTIGQKVRPTPETAKTLKAFFGVEGEGVVEQVNTAYGQAYVRFGNFSVIDSFSSFEPAEQDKWAGAAFKEGGRVTSRWTPGGCTWIVRDTYMEGLNRKYVAEVEPVVPGRLAVHLFAMDLTAADATPVKGFTPPSAVEEDEARGGLVDDVHIMLMEAFHPKRVPTAEDKAKYRNTAREVIGAVIKRLSDELAR